MIDRASLSPQLTRTSFIFVSLYGSFTIFSEKPAKINKNKYYTCFSSRKTKLASLPKDVLMLL
jgi:hypothetical protein